MLQHKRVANAERVKELVDSAFATRYHNLEATLRNASMAVVLAEENQCEIPVDLLVAAWTEFGNALRIAGRYEEAEKALNRAAKETVSDPPTHIHLLEVMASLHRNTRKFESAAQFLVSAIEIEKSIGNLDGEARHYNHLGLVYLDAGDLQRALLSYKTALDFLGPDAPLDVVASTGHNLVEALIADGRLSAASSALVLLEPFHRRLTSARLSSKCAWLRARLCRELKQFTAARLAYERAYALMSTEPRSPELAELAKEMEALPAASDPRA